MDFSIGSSACHIAVSQIQKRKAVDVELYINDDKELFKSLFAYKDENREKYGNGIRMERIAGKKSKSYFD